MMPWQDDCGLVTLPTGPRVRGRRSSDKVSSADFALILGDSSPPDRPYRHIRWRDFWIPNDRVQALDALHKALRRAHDGERVEVVCSGGIGRTGTALAALAILDGLSPNHALHCTVGSNRGSPGNDAGSEKSADPNWAVFRQLSDETPVGASVPRPSCGAAFTAPSSAPASGSGRPSDRGGD